MPRCFTTKATLHAGWLFYVPAHMDVALHTSKQDTQNPDMKNVRCQEISTIEQRPKDLMWRALTPELAYSELLALSALGAT